MNALLIAAAVVCQWDMAPPKTGAGAAAAWDMSPLKRAASLVDQAQEKAQAAPAFVGYPARGGTRYWVFVGNQRYSASPEHLLQGEHAGMFDEAWVRTLSQEDRDWLHSHAHAGTVNWQYAKRPGEYIKPAAVEKPKMKLVREQWCQNGRCYYRDVWVRAE